MYCLYHFIDKQIKIITLQTTKTNYNLIFTETETKMQQTTQKRSPMKWEIKVTFEDIINSLNT